MWREIAPTLAERFTVVEEPELRVGVVDIRDDQRLRHQIGQTIDRIACVCRIPGCDCGRLDRKAAGKDAESPEKLPFVLGE
jgi:hypothetical protein